MTEDGFDAVFIGSGAGAPNFMPIKGMNLTTVFSANEFTYPRQSHEAYKFPNMIRL